MNKNHVAICATCTKGQNMGLKGIKDITLRNILYLLWDNDVTELDFCLAIGINKSAVTDWKNGKTSSYKKYLPEIAGYFKTSVLDLTRAEFIADKLNAYTHEPVDSTDADRNRRLNMFQSFHPEIQDIALDVMTGIVERAKSGQ